MKWSSQLSAAWIAILFIILIAVISTLSFYWTFHRVVPSLDGNVRVPGLHNRVTINWSPYQVPHITAQQETDLYLAMGYVHAKDRLWQMTRKQYKLEGLHSREIGEDMLGKDLFYLTLSFGQIAKNAYENMPQQDKVLLEAYSRGVNSFIRNHRKHLPPEFALSDVEPIPWEPWHSVGVLILWHWESQQSFWSKPALASLQYADDGMVIRALTGTDIPGEVLFGPDRPALETAAFQSLMDGYLDFSREARPLTAGRSGTGFAMTLPGPVRTSLLTYSRESPLSLPDGTYEMVLQSEQGWRSGVSIPGLPVLLTGQNENLAWAVLPLISDDGDFFTGNLFREPTVQPTDWEQDPTVTYRLNDDLTVERHILNLKNGGEKQLVLKKASGLPVVAVSEDFNKYLAFDWTGSDHASDFGPLRALSTARNPNQLVDAAESMHSPAVQLLYVTSDGRTGRISAGRMPASPYPLRISDWEAPGASSLSSPASNVIPHVRNNSGDPVAFLEQAPSSRPAVGTRCIYSPPWDRTLRLARLVELTPPERLLSDATTQWHNDTYSDFAAELTPYIVRALEVTSGLPGSESMQKLVIPYLKNWNYEFGANETAATLFQVFLDRAAKNLYSPWMNENVLQSLHSTPQVSHSAVSSLLMNPYRWPDSHPVAYYDWISGSMSETVEFLSERLGSEPFDWQWSRALQATFIPILFDATRGKSLPARLAERNLYQPNQVTVSGSSHTLNAMVTGSGLSMTIAAATTHKRVMVLDPDHTWHSVISTGQSGNLFSGHFSDQLKLWKGGFLKGPATITTTETHIFEHTQYLVP